MLILFVRYTFEDGYVIKIFFNPSYFFFLLKYNDETLKILAIKIIYL